MATMNISLPDAMKAYAEAQASGGRFANVSDYMRDLIRRDQERTKAREEIQALAQQGIASGPARPFDMAAFLAARRKA